MNCCILGSGAVGTYLAFKLAASAENVNLISCHRQAGEIKKISKDGFFILESSSDGGRITSRFHPNISSLKHGIPPCDLLIFCIKAFQIQEVLHSINFAPKNILTLMNGYGFHAAFHDIFPNTRLIIGSVHFGVTQLKKNTFIHEGGNGIHIALYGKTGDQGESILHNLKDLFGRAGFSVKTKNDYKKMLFKKLLVNSVINPLTAVWNIPKGKLLESQERISIVHELIDEALLVFSCEGCRWDKEYALKLIQQTISNTPDRSSSMADDVQRGRKSEIDYINGAILVLARKHGLELPATQGIVEMIHKKSGGNTT